MTWKQQIFQWLMSFVCFVSTWLVNCRKENKEILQSNVLPPGRLHSQAFSLHIQQWWAPSDRTWKINYLNIWNIEYLKYWIFEILNLWNIGYLKYWISEISHIWNIEYLKYWIFLGIGCWILNIWNTEVLEKKSTEKKDEISNCKQFQTISMNILFF